MSLELVGAIAGRSPEVWDAYQAHRRSHAGICPFCADPHTVGNDLIGVHGSMVVLRNLFPYAVWDDMRVADHLMVVPARHLLTFDEFSREEALDHFGVVRRYERNGYSIYTRSQANTGRSVGHLHTHLILTEALKPGG